MKASKKRDKFGRTAEDRALIAKQAKVTLRFRKLWKALFPDEKKADRLDQRAFLFCELLTAKLLWLSVDELRRDQSRRLFEVWQQRITKNENI